MIRYRVGFERPASHHVDVRLEVAAAGPDLKLWLPAWTPGSYLVREFARNLRDVQAVDASGRVLGVTRLDKATVAVAAPAGAAVTVRYRVFAHERSVRTTYVDDRGALVNGASVFLAVEGHEHEPHAVELELPSGWNVATTLEPAGGAGRFVAEDFARLVDAPLLLGDLREFAFAVDGVPHALVFLGDGNYDGAALAESARKIVAVNARTFGGLPYRRYLFLVLATPDGRGGLEHRDCSVLQHPRFEFKDEAALFDFNALVAHEHLHVWNVKRFRPADFHPYDLRRETYTRLLWLVEGVTAYLDELVPLRAGLVTRERWWKRLAEEITRYHETPARRAETLEEASLLAWVRLYRPDADTPNSGVNYYQQGALAGLALDLELRARSDGRHGVEDLLARLDRRFGDGAAGYTAADVEALARELTGADVRPVFDRLFRSTDEIDFARALAPFGVAWERRPRTGGPTVRDLLGVRLDPNQTRALIDTVERGSPADAAGLSARDEIVAVDGFRARLSDLAKRLAERAGGNRVSVTVFRDDELRSFSVALPVPPAHVVTLAEDPRAPPRARTLRDAWLRDQVPAAAPT